ncbi:hypothetical protein HMPREF0077_2059 [Anaerococcus tetradius ATCC 35098]|uniref:Uncharacterized protein n=1 Tax=Anaerococcus tetradius ATCC 35098 TaxID=525255 RepID=C2CKP9_9FIRM|nr:hypothetical protein HMPREF0077_2059 [Anaerococcus tetradius ATCC 35098]
MGSYWRFLCRTRSKKEYKDPKNIEGRSGQKESITEKLSGYKAKDLMGIPWQLALKLREDGWYLRRILFGIRKMPCLSLVEIDHQVL